MNDFGNLFFIGFQNQFEKDFLERINPCGIILYPENMNDVYKLQINMERIYSLFDKGYHFFISSDHEGGQLETVPNIFPSPGNMAIGKVGGASEFGNYLAHMLKLHGFNMVFAPVVDVKHEKSSHVTGFRAYSDDHEIIKMRALEFIRSLLDENIAPTLKHFPGHGKAREDSHFTLPVVLDFDESDEDMMVFKELSKHVDFVMTAHVMYPKLDEVVATLSKKILKGILREKFGYKGLIISDAFEMKALYKNYSPKEVIKRFFEADGDIILIGDIENHYYLIETFNSMIKNGELDIELLKEKVEKIKKIKEKYVSDTYPTRFLSKIAKQAIDFKLDSPVENPSFLIPQAKNLSLADTSQKDLKYLRNLIKEEFKDAKIYTSSSEISNEDTVIYFVLDKVENVNAKRVIYVFLRNVLKKDVEYVNPYSSKLISIYHVLQLFKGEGLL
jgi:beta-N-acetylhexosaminidase